jgi:hypothetical protein
MCCCFCTSDKLYRAYHSILQYSTVQMRQIVVKIDWLVKIVRTDLTELRDLDLGGAPYGYTPFCDSNKDMEGFRFWKQVNEFTSSGIDTTFLQAIRVCRPPVWKTGSATHVAAGILTTVSTCPHTQNLLSSNWKGLPQGSLTPSIREEHSLYRGGSESLAV